MRLSRHQNGFVLTAMTTPFTHDRIDRRSLQTAVDLQLAAGMDGIVILDPIGEGSTIADHEREEIVACCVERVNRSMLVIVATGTNSTRVSVERTRRAIDRGADAVLVTVPYYSKPQLAGVVEHFRTIGDCGLPIIVDDDPGRTAKDYGEGLLHGLAAIETVVAIAHGPGRSGCVDRLRPDLRDRYIHIGRDDRQVRSARTIGLHGMISAAANILPKHIRRIVSACPEQEVEQLAQEISAALAGLGSDDVAALKTAMCLVHGFPADVRLPMVSPDADEIIRIQDAFARFIEREGHSAAAGRIA